ncbi:hypothetical protein GYB29_10715 [bacterium]|nr:hypothetical protein [bacterium]
MNNLFIISFSILCGSIIHIIFRYFSRFNISKFQAVVVNYLVCSLIGLGLSGDKLSQVWNTEWFLLCFFLGIIFVTVFWLMAYNTEVHGASINAMSSKMAVVVPVVFSIFVLKEQIHYLAIIGVCLSIPAILLISLRKDVKLSKTHKSLPILVFLCSGAIDLILKLLEMYQGNVASSTQLSYGLFMGAFTFGALALLYQAAKQGKKLLWKNSIAGLILGIPNYFSIALLLAFLNAYPNNSTFVFGMYNTGIVLVSSILSSLIFKEIWTRQKLFGLILVILSVILVAYGQ